MLKVAPILNGLDKLSHGETVVLNINGELEDVGKRINETSLQLDKQNKARANWISGVSHDQPLLLLEVKTAQFAVVLLRNADRLKHVGFQFLLGFAGVQHQKSDKEHTLILRL